MRQPDSESRTVQRSSPVNGRGSPCKTDEGLAGGVLVFKSLGPEHRSREGLTTDSRRTSLYSRGSQTPQWEGRSLAEVGTSFQVAKRCRVIKMGEVCFSLA